VTAEARGAESEAFANVACSERKAARYWDAGAVVDAVRIPIGCCSGL
jgi:hypothetical protein